MPVTKKGKKPVKEEAKTPPRNRSISKSPSKQIQQKSATKPKDKKKAKKSESQTRAKSTPKTISVKEEKILYKADTHAAVLDQDSEKDDEEVFWLIKILEDVKEGDQEVECDLFKPEGEQLEKFKIGSTTTTIMSADVIMEVSPQILKSRSKNQPPSLKLKKLQINQIKKLQKGIVENRHAKEDEQASIEDQEPESKKQSKAQPERKIKKIVGVKKSLPQSQAAEPQRQLRARKQPEPVQVKDQDMEESKTRRSTSKTATKRTKKSEPAAGKKRRRGGSEESDSSDDDGERAPKDEVVSQRAGEKRRRVQVGKKEVIESIPQTKVKKEKPKPTEYKRGVWNPDVEIIAYEHAREAKDTTIFSECCKRCAQRSFHRAALTGNARLLAECIQKIDTISDLNRPWSPEVPTTAFEAVIQSGNKDLLQAMLRPPVKQQVGEDYE